MATPADLIGKTDLELLPPQLAEKFFADEQQIVRTGQPVVDQEEIAWGLKQAISTTKVALRNERNEIFGVAGISRDITERKLADALRDGQAQILKMIAMSAPLPDVLEDLVLLVELFKGIVGAVMLLDETRNRLRRGASPSLVEAFAKAVDGRPLVEKRAQRHGRLSAESRRRLRYHDQYDLEDSRDPRPRVAFIHAGRRRSCRVRAKFSAVRDLCEGTTRTDRRRTRLVERDPHRRHRDRTHTR